MRITLDPWRGNYASQVTIPYEVDSEATPVQALEEQIEERPWAPVDPPRISLPTVTAVVDGVMRSDANAVVEIDKKRFLGLFCSYATGAVTINQKVEIVDDQVERLFIVGNGQSGPGVVKVPAGNREPLYYESVSSRAKTPDKLSEALMSVMRGSEKRVAEALSSPDSLILVDGNLSFFDRRSSVVGVIKTIQRMYLTPQKATILECLRPGERTPLFRLPGSSQRSSYISCYLRLSHPRPIENSFAGLVRLEVDDFLGKPKATALLDQASVQVFALASRAPKDPRAPQNLIPIGGLERHLRHKLGDPQLVRRGIEKALRAML
jgi:hypothetical protein